MILFGKKFLLCLNSFTLKDIIEQLIKQALNTLSWGEHPFAVEHPGELSHGEYASNVAMVYAKKIGKSPRVCAEELLVEIQKNTSEEIEKIEIAGPGFLNFYLSQKFFVDTLRRIVADGDFGKGKLLFGKKVVFEYTDPNPFKAFHIGHLMANAIGESLSRIGEFQGAEVKRICYQGDIGLHVAKTVWAMKKARLAFPQDSDSFSDKIKFMGDAYVTGVNAYEDDLSVQAEIREINKKLFEKSDADLAVYYEKGRAWSLDYFEEIYKKLGTHFDDYIFESEVSKQAVDIVKNYTPEVFEESEGAVVFKGEKYGLHTRVFLNKEGLPTYEAKELANAMEKAKRHQFDFCVITSANEIKEYFKVVLKAMSLIDQKNGEKTSFVGHGMLRLPEGKMGSRKGNVITGESLIADTEHDVFLKMTDREIEESLKKDIATKVAIGAIKYTILHQSIGKDIIFDKEKSLSFEGDSGPYLQYAFVRTGALLAKAEKEAIASSLSHPPATPYEIEKILYMFPEVVERAWSEKSPHGIVEYLIRLAGVFNSFYAEGLIVSKEVDAPYKLAIVEATRNILKRGLWLLGIETVPKM